jgi:hypothetical protein
MMTGELAHILTEVLNGRQLCEMTPDERDDALSQATSIYKTRAPASASIVRAPGDD